MTLPSGPSPGEPQDASKASEESVLSPDELEVLDQVAKEPPAVSDSALRLIMETARHSEQSRKLVEQAENAERVRKLEFFELHLDPDAPHESPDLLQHETLYNMHLLSDEALLRLSQGDESLYEEEMFRGRMMNRIRPLPREEEEYRALYERVNKKCRNPIPYETVWEQHVADLLGSSDRPGRYRFFGLRDPAGHGKLVASLTMLLPPPAQDPHMEAYCEAARKWLKRIHFQQGWDSAPTFQQIPQTGEIDTIISDPAFRGAGMRLVYETLARLQDEGVLPEHLMYYRSNGIVMRDREGARHPTGVNSSSYAFFVKKLGFTDMGDRSDSHDVMVREIVPGGELFVAKTRWTFGRTHTKKLVDRISKIVPAQRFIDGESRLRPIE